MKTILALVLMSLVCNVTAASSTDLSGVADAYERSRAVFIGKVVKIEPFTTELDADFSRSYRDPQPPNPWSTPIQFGFADRRALFMQVV